MRFLHCWCVWLGLLIGFFAVPFALGDAVYLWPMPRSVSRGSQSLFLSKDFKLTTEGSKYKDTSGILKDGFSKVLDVIKMQHVVDGAMNGSYTLEGLHVLISSPVDELNFGVDESYKLSIPATGSPIYGFIQANTIFGALHGLQTFSQMCQFNLTIGVIEVQRAPWTIRDEPRFPYRGLLIDTSRHYQPLSVIKKIIDAMAYTKLNVLHWHIVDSQSFPLEIPSYPRLWNGAYSKSERYTMADAIEVVKYAERQGINVLAEIDVPGHALSWQHYHVGLITHLLGHDIIIYARGVGYPNLWPAFNCQQPLDVSNEFTFQVIDGILSDFSKVFKFKFVHLGGDEVDTGCWRNTRHIRRWLYHNNVNESEAYKYFVLRAQSIAITHGYDIVNWEETFNNFGSQLNPKTVVHNWLGGGVAQKVVKAGLRCIVSNQDSWYLDHLDTRWEQFYLNEPLTNIIDPVKQKLVIGGEVCMWGETVDGSDVEQTIWPRAAAAAERLWTTSAKLDGDLRHVGGRLAHFRCLLNQRGVAAAPLDGPGRVTPYEPGSCYKQ